MKIVFISDTHTKHNEIDIPNGDMLICSGDFTNVGSENDVRKFNKWMGTLPHKHKIAISGNHDFFFERCERKWIDSICTNFTYIKDESIVVEGLKIYGSPWTPKFGEWAFSYPRKSEQLKLIWDMIPEDTDILVTHAPPYGTLDACPLPQGCEHLADRVLVVKPKIHTFGHIHEGAGTVIKDGIQYVNASCLDGMYQAVNDPIVIDI